MERKRKVDSVLAAKQMLDRSNSRQTSGSCLNDLTDYETQFRAHLGQSSPTAT